jgi:hypothetical protein
LSSENPQEIEFASKAEFFYIAMSMLVMDKKEAIIPETMYFLEPDQLIRLSKVYGGTYVYVPTPKELSAKLNAAAAAYYRFHLNLSWEEIGRRIKMTGVHLNPIKKVVERWEEYMANELGVRPNLLVSDGSKSGKKGAKRG